MVLCCRLKFVCFYTYLCAIYKSSMQNKQAFTHQKMITLHIQGAVLSQVLPAKPPASVASDYAMTPWRAVPDTAKTSKTSSIATPAQGACHRCNGACQWIAVQTHHPHLSAPLLVLLQALMAAVWKLGITYCRDGLSAWWYGICPIIFTAHQHTVVLGTNVLVGNPAPDGAPASANSCGCTEHM